MVQLGAAGEAGMDRGIWAVWYDLRDEDRQNFIDWLHQRYMPFLNAVNGHAWAAHYAVGMESDDVKTMDDFKKRPDPKLVPGGAQYLLLVGAPSPQVFFHDTSPAQAKNVAPDVAAQLSKRVGVREGFFVEQERVNGPEYALSVPGGVPGPAVQFGSLQLESEADAVELNLWYAQYRLPFMAHCQSSIVTRKLVGVAGWATNGIMYEFSSLEERREHFEIAHESLGLDENEWSGKIFRMAIHAPGSPTIATRTWPPLKH